MSTVFLQWALTPAFLTWDWHLSVFTGGVNRRVGWSPRRIMIRSLRPLDEDVHSNMFWSTLQDHRLSWRPVGTQKRFPLDSPRWAADVCETSCKLGSRYTWSYFFVCMKKCWFCGFQFVGDKTFDMCKVKWCQCWWDLITSGDRTRTCRPGVNRWNYIQFLNNINVLQK